MPSSIRGTSIDAAIRNDEDMRRLLNGVAYKMAIYDRQLGIFDGFLDDPLQVPVAKPVPPAAGFTVTGVDGKFEIQITLPQDTQPQTVTLYQARLDLDMNWGRAPIVHQLQSATNMLFDASGNVSTYGPTPETSLSITQPNVTLFWRLRSSYDQVNWNDWQIYSSAAVCGPIGVNSGVMRSSSISTNSVWNTTNDATVTVSDVDATNESILVYGPGGAGSNWNLYRNGTLVNSYPAATFTNKSYNTRYYLGFDVALQQWTVSLSYKDTTGDNMVQFSVQTNASSGGGGAVGGGGGTADGGTGGTSLNFGDRPGFGRIL